MPPHPLTNFEILKYNENQARFNGAYSRDNLPNKMSIQILVLTWVALNVKNNDITYFDSFGLEHIPKEIKAFIKNRNIKTNID